MRDLRKVLAIVLMLLVSTVASAQKATMDPEFSTFWKTFKELVAKNDKDAIADVTKLPFLYDSKERDRAGFIKIYPQLFTPKIRRCFVSAKPTREQDNYDVFCGELIFYFGKDTDGKFKLLEFGVND